MVTTRLSDAIRSRASYGRLKDRRADWPPDHRWRRFVRDGEVPITVIRPDHQPDGEPGINRLDTARQAIRSEAMARERAERSLEEAQVTIRKGSPTGGDRRAGRSAKAIDGPGRTGGRAVGAPKAPLSERR